MRLSDRSPSRDKAVLQVDGWVSGGWVQVLEREGTRLLKQSRRLVLMMDGVRHVDKDGLELLRRWSRQGVVFREVSSFLTLMLSEGPDSDQVDPRDQEEES